MRPTLAITIGDPNGIGPEVVLKALTDPRVRAACRPLVVGDRALLERTADACGLELSLDGDDVVDLGNVPAHLEPGTVAAEAGEAAYGAIEEAVRLCLAGDADALVTAPIHKVGFELAGRGHQGHTELLQQLTASEWSQTMFMLNDLRVLFYSRHLSLRDAIDAVRADLIVLQLERFASVAWTFGLPSPRIAVAALNPHAGEGGLFGREEIDHIEPGVATARERGIDVHGPIPGDSVFHLAREGHFDVVLSLYHDQAAGILKSIDFQGTVSVTLGLPFLRFSVDHGTALDIAGRNLADPRNMVNTLLLASRYSAGGQPRAS